MMKTAVNSSADAITGGGMIARTATNPGRNAPTARIAAMTNAMRRLATPVAATRPTLAVDTVSPYVPSKPATAAAIPSPKMPPRIEFISGRTHSASVMRW